MLKSEMSLIQTLKRDLTYNPHIQLARCDTLKSRGVQELGSVELTANEWRQAANHRDRYWLYVVYHCDTDEPRLYPCRDPFGNLIANSHRKYADQRKRHHEKLGYRGIQSTYPIITGHLKNTKHLTVSAGEDCILALSKCLINSRFYYNSELYYNGDR